MALRREPAPEKSYVPQLVRPMRTNDLAACHRIDRCTRGDAAWTEIEWFDLHKEFPAYVCIRDKVIAGFVMYEIRKSSIRLVRIATHPHVWRCGVGTKLMEWTTDTMIRHGKRYIEAMVPLTTPSLSALLFFKSLGIPGYLADGDGGEISFIKENPRLSKNVP